MKRAIHVSGTDPRKVMELARLLAKHGWQVIVEREERPQPAVTIEAAGRSNSVKAGIPGGRWAVGGNEEIPWPGSAVFETAEEARASDSWMLSDRGVRGVSAGCTRGFDTF